MYEVMESLFNLSKNILSMLAGWLRAGVGKSKQILLTTRVSGYNCKADFQGMSHVYPLVFSHLPTFLRMLLSIFFLRIG